MKNINVKLWLFPHAVHPTSVYSDYICTSFFLSCSIIIHPIYIFWTDFVNSPEFLCMCFMYISKCWKHIVRLRSEWLNTFVFSTVVFFLMWSSTWLCCNFPQLSGLDEVVIYILYLWAQHDLFALHCHLPLNTVTQMPFTHVLHRLCAHSLLSSGWKDHFKPYWFCVNY